MPIYFQAKSSSSGEGSIDVNVGGGLAIRADCLTASSCPRGGEMLFLSVRPEAVELQEIGAVCKGVNHIRGQVIAAAYRGSLIEYEIAAGDHVIKAHVVNPKGNPCLNETSQFASASPPKM
jgi:hypothetical protein